MKALKNLKIILIIGLVISCKNDKTTTPKNTEEQQTKVSIKKEDSITKTPSYKTEDEPNLGIYYVSATSGLNFRETPKGSILGKFDVNTRLKIIEKTDVFEEIVDDGKVLKGEWLGVKNGEDTVYIFSAFLSSSFTYSDLKLYEATPFRKRDTLISDAFVNVSESFPWSFKKGDISIFPKAQIGKDTIRFSADRKKEFLKMMTISSSDSLYLFNMQTDSVFKYTIDDLELVASVSPYETGNNELTIYDYQIGFSLGKTFKTGGYTLAYIGNESPFQNKKIETIDWQSTTNAEFTKKFISAKNVPEVRKNWFNGFEPYQTFKYSNSFADFYIQELYKNEQYQHRYLIIVNKETNNIIFEEPQISTEGTYEADLFTENADFGSGQWTGAIFKNKPPIIYGFTTYSFGCASIKFLGENELEIPIRCDNRH